MTDSTNTVVWEAVYEPFGEAEINANSTIECNFRFKGQYYDSETGFHYNYNRYYDPNTGRYLKADPIGLRGGINLYAYVLNNPINSSDPFGLELIGEQIRKGDDTVIVYYDTDTGAEYIYTGVKETAPKTSPKTGTDYGPNAKLPPDHYVILPREDNGSILKKGYPLYTTPGKKPGIIIDPEGNVRTNIGAHYGSTSYGCPLFPTMKESKRYQKMMWWYMASGSVSIDVIEMMEDEECECE